jgi:hypothetical protein
MGTAEALRWGVVRGQHLTGPTPQMQTAQSLLGSLRNALNEAGGPGSARSTIDVDDDMSSDEVQETPVYKPSGAKDGPGMLAWLSGAYGGTDEDSMMGWRDPHIGVSVEALVRERVEEQGVSVHVAVKDLSDAIKADKHLQPAFASKLLALTAALREEAILAGKLGQHDALSGIAEKDLWRLVAPAKGQADNDKWLADSVNQGSLAGMLRGFGHMIEAQEQGEPITAESLAELHGDMTAGTFKMGIDIDEDSMRFPQGLRDGEGTDLGLDGGGVVTDAGRAELREAAANDPWFKLRDGDDGAISVEFEPRSGDEVRTRADTILANYEKEKSAATTPEEKRLAVARATQDLYRSHLFQDGNTRTVVFLTMNRLLLDAGLGPAILAEPRAAAGYSLREFAAEIEKGQAAFEALRS